MKKECKVYIRGVQGRGEEVIKALADLGAVNHWDYTGDSTNVMYYIKHDGYIGHFHYNTEFAQIIMDNYREIKLPEQWKDGDILFSEADNEFAVFEVEHINSDKFFSYLSTCYAGYLTHQDIPKRGFRLATESEINQFYKRLHAINKDWDAEKKQLVDLKWKNGDVLIRKDGGSFVIFHCYLSDSSVSPLLEVNENVCNGYSRIMPFFAGFYRLATSSEIKYFHELLHAHGKEWDTEKKKLVDWKWKPELHKGYFYVSSDLSVGNTFNDGLTIDVDRISCGNCFHTDEEAKVMAEKIKKLLKGE